jgi:tetratricopeptide (TPR) repeat protein
MCTRKYLLVVLLGLAAACEDAHSPRRPAARARQGATTSAARSNDDAERSMALGAKLQSEKSFGEAIAAYEQAYRLGRDPRALFGVAQCHRSNRRMGPAYETYERILAVGDANLTPQQAQAAQKGLSDLAPVTAQLAINVSETDADVDVDSRTWGRTPVLKHHRVGVGAHVVHVTKAGFAPFESEVVLAGGDSRVVDVKLVDSKASSPTELPEAERRSGARAAFQEGVALQDDGNCTEAIGRFQAAQRLYEAPTHLLHLAQCLTSTGKLLDAQEAYETLTRMKLDAHPPMAFVKAQDAARADLPALKARVPTLRLQTTPPAAGLDGLVILVNGTRMPNDLIGVARPLNPGPYKIQATAGALHATTDVELKERAAVSLDVHLTR